jgi:hypothetical protein
VEDLALLAQQALVAHLAVLVAVLADRVLMEGVII